jgi:hypothetical protein
VGVLEGDDGTEAAIEDGAEDGAEGHEGYHRADAQADWRVEVVSREETDLVVDRGDFADAVAQLHAGEGEDGDDVEDREQSAPGLHRGPLQHLHALVQQPTLALQLVLAVPEQIDIKSHVGHFPHFDGIDGDLEGLLVSDGHSLVLHLSLSIFIIPK